MEVGRHLEELAVQLELLLAHVAVLTAELLPPFVLLMLLLLDLSHLLGQVALVLPVAVVVFKLNVVMQAVVVLVVNSIVRLVSHVVNGLLVVRDGRVRPVLWMMGVLIEAVMIIMAVSMVVVRVVLIDVLVEVMYWALVN